MVVKNAGLRNPEGASKWMTDEIDSPEYIIYGGIFILYFQDEQHTYMVTGKKYKIQPSVEEIENGIIPFVPELHAHLWDYVLCDGQLYSNHPDLVDWDQGVEEWKDSVMGQWPFGVQLSAEQKLINKALDCLDSLDSYLQFEEWELDQIEAQEEADDDDDDVDVDLESEDEGYDTEDDDDIEMEQWNFGIAPMLWQIQL